MTLAFMTTMTFHVRKRPDGNYHVQNSVGGKLGQHHVHTAESFEKWRKPSDEITIMDDGPCHCGLSPGQVRNHDGKIWTNPKFASQ